MVLAGGTDAMSAPLMFNEHMAAWLARWFAAKSFGQRLGLASQFRLSYLAPVIALLRGNRPDCRQTWGKLRKGGFPF